MGRGVQRRTGESDSTHGVDDASSNPSAEPDEPDEPTEADEPTEKGGIAESGPVVVLDATVFGADPLCSSTAWRVLAQATRAWGVRVVVPSVVFAEAVGGYQRSAGEALIGFDRWQTKQRARQLGFEAIAAGVGEAINAQADVFEKTLRTRLDDIGAEIVPVPTIDHAVLIGRAIARRRPCDHKGDGYRDTLNWFTVLALLADTEAEVVWVSNNHLDFGTGDSASAEATESVAAVDDAANASSGPLHKHLVDDVAAIGAQDRLTWVLDLPELVAHLAAGRADVVGASPPAIFKSLEKQALLAFVTDVATSHLMGLTVSPSRTACRPRPSGRQWSISIPSRT